MAPLRTFFRQEADNRATTTQRLFEFRKTGIYPGDRNVFDEVDFAPAETTTRNQQAANGTSGAIPEEIPDYIPMKTTPNISRSLSAEAEPSGIRTIKTSTNVDATESDVS
ncbi:hypothetical protein QE152_g4634 [Popillia japonica]|uniref:Uncharacterized protein n=1 Tax=Popillia japonica TaxID=7064 RepID=A0AAW1MU74_POPJA